MTNSDGERVKSNLISSFDEELSSVRVDVLVLGPNVRGRELNQAARLRREILARCRAFWGSVKGELRELIREAEAKLGSAVSLCTYEMELAKVSDAIVIVPASPGSFAEFGLFAMVDDLRARILVLLDRDHKNRRSYLKLGPARSIGQRGGIIRWVDYGKTDAVWTVVEKHIEEAKELKLNRRRFGGR